MILPITPKEAKQKAQTAIPSFIIQAVNDLICLKIGSNDSVVIKQDDILEQAGAGLNKPEFRRQIYDNKWLDIEDLYVKFGWKVEYDKPAYCESYPATFKFTKL